MLNKLTKTTMVKVHSLAGEYRRVKGERTVWAELAPRSKTGIRYCRIKRLQNRREALELVGRLKNLGVEAEAYQAWSKPDPFYAVTWQWAVKFKYKTK